MAKIFRTETLSLADNIRLASSGTGAFEIQNTSGSTLMSKATIESDISSLQAAVTAEETSRSTKDTSLDSDVSSLQAAVTAEETSRSTKDTSLDSDISSLVAKDGDVDSDISSLQAAVTAEETSRSTKDTSLDSDVSSLQAAVTAEENSRSTKDTSLDSDVSSLQAAVTAEENSRSTKDTDLDSDISSLASNIAANDVVAISSSVTNGQDNSGSISFGRTFASTPIVVAQLKSSDANDPIIACMVSSLSTSACTVTFADNVPSANYTLELIASIG